MKKFSLTLLIILFSLSFTSCFFEKRSLFYDSEWIMKNYDADGKLYYQHLILEPNHRVMLRASYADSTNIIVWTGKYKINSRKIVFKFAECVRFENEEIVGQYKAGQLVNFYSGEFYYSVAGIEVEGAAEEVEGQEEAKEKNALPVIYHLELIRPKNYFYGENKDIFGNPLEEFIKVK